MNTDPKVPDFDYDWLETCIYPVYRRTSAQEEDCGEPAVARIMWEEDPDDIHIDDWLVCQKHLDFMLEPFRHEEKK